MRNSPPVKFTLEVTLIILIKFLVVTTIIAFLLLPKKCGDENKNRYDPGSYGDKTQSCETGQDT